eukprot:8339469-Alexandrium_andersonii.AAC.1
MLFISAAAGIERSGADGRSASIGTGATIGLLSRAALWNVALPPSLKAGAHEPCARLSGPFPSFPW